MAVTEISVRLTDEAWRNLQRVSRVRGLSTRAAFEAAFLCFLDVAEGDRPLSPAERRTHEVAWEVARRLDAEAATGTMQRRKVNLRVDACLHARVRAACARRSVSINGLAAATFSPWGAGWGGKAEHKARAELWARAMDAARKLDYERRTGRAGDETG